MNSYKFSLLLLTIIGLMVVGCRTNLDEEQDLQQQEYKIYTLVAGQYIHEGINLLTIEDRTISPYREMNTSFDFIQYIKEQSPALAQETADHFRSKNNQQYDIERLLDIEIDYVLIKREEFEEIIHGSATFDEGWQTFLDTHSSAGIMAFSRVGFNSDGNQALLYFERGCGPECGSGIFFLLVKDGKNWKIQEKIPAWNA